MEKIMSRVRPEEPEVAFNRKNEFIKSLSHLPPDEALQRIAEERFRRPIVIFNALTIRPFWRDGRKAPPLKYDKRR